MSHLDSVKSALPEGAALLITSEINQRWISGFDYTDGYILVTHGGSYLLTDFRYIEAARAQSDRGLTVIMPDDTMLSALGRLFADEKVARLAIEDATLSVATADKLKKSFDGVDFVTGGSALLDDLREFKDDGEISKIKTAQAITDAAFEHILGYITPDRTEIDVALELE